MINATVPVAMMFATLGLMLGFVPMRTALVAAVASLITAFGVAALPMAPNSFEFALVACWLTIVAMSIIVYWPRLQSAPLVIGLAVVAGVTGGVALANPSRPADPLAVLALGAAIPSSIAAVRGYTIAPRVVTGWLLAVTMLGAILPHIVAHPGYVPDHRG